MTALDPGEFDPPASYSFEPELTGPPPRPLPDSLNEGPYATQFRANMLRGFAFGSMCLLLNQIPGVETLAYYFLPLAYLNLIGLTSIGLAAISAIYHALRLGPFRYVQNGVPLVARIASLSIATAPMTRGTGSVHKAGVAYRHPHTGALTHSVVTSRHFPVLAANEHVPPFKVGDYATAVYLPRRSVEKSLQLYAFLDLSPQVNTDSVPVAESSRRTVMAIFALASVALVLLAGLYALERYEPLDFELQNVVPLASGGSLLAVALFYFLVYRRQRRPPKRFHTVVVGSTVALVGGFLGVAGGFMANVWLDRSPAELRPARILSYSETTYEYVLRAYYIHYQIAGSPDGRSLITTLAHIRRFRNLRAVVRIRRGAFGWPWVESVDPAVLDESARPPGS